MNNKHLSSIDGSDIEAVLKIISIYSVTFQSFFGHYIFLSKKKRTISSSNKSLIVPVRSSFNNSRAKRW